MYDKTDNRNYNISQIIVKYLIKHNLIDWSSFEILVSTQTFADFYINSTNGKRLKEYENSSLHVENE